MALYKMFPIQNCKVFDFIALEKQNTSGKIIQFAFRNILQNPKRGKKKETELQN